MNTEKLAEKSISAQLELLNTIVSKQRALMNNAGFSVAPTHDLLIQLKPNADRSYTITEEQRTLLINLMARLKNSDQWYRLSDSCKSYTDEIEQLEKFLNLIRVAS